MICDDNRSNDNSKCDLRIIETLDSRRISRDRLDEESYELRFYVQGTNDECEVMARIKPGDQYGLPSTFPDVSYVPVENSTIGGNLRSYPLQNLDVQCVGWKLWEVRATYAYGGAISADPAVLQLPTSISMSTRGGNVRITQSIATMLKYPDWPQTDEPTPPDMDGAIEWDGRTIKGINVPSPLTRYSESWIFDRFYVFSPVTIPVQKQDPQDFDAPDPDNVVVKHRFQVWEQFTATVHGPVHYKPWWDSPGDPNAPPNAAQYSDAYDAEPETQRNGFRNWAPGSTMLDNVNIRQVGLNHFEVTFDFLIRSNYSEKLPDSFKQDTSEGNGSDTTVEIDGWDHYWNAYEKTSGEAKDTTGSTKWEVVTPIRRFGYVERIIERRDFKWLGIGLNPHNTSMSNDFCYSAPNLMYNWQTICGGR